MQVQGQITLTAGTPINLATGSGIGDWENVIANSLFVQVRASATSGLSYVLVGYGQTAGAPRVPSKSNASDLVAQMVKAADANTPGGSYSDTKEYHGIPINKLWVDGEVTGTVIGFSYDRRV